VEDWGWTRSTPDDAGSGLRRPILAAIAPSKRQFRQALAQFSIVTR
jgi:hypothetical protein